MNCLVEQKIDALMTRTKFRPLPRGQITPLETLIFSGIVGGIDRATWSFWQNQVFAATATGGAAISAEQEPLHFSRMIQGRSRLSPLP